MKDIVDKLYNERFLPKNELKLLIDCENNEYLFQRAMERREEFYGRDVYIRGLIEFTNHCGNNCFYCGLRAGNRNLCRYRMDKADILKCCETGYRLGFRTFVLQGGEDFYYTDERICDIVSSIKREFGDCAVTLSIGEKTEGSYRAYKDAGADRYLLRHETADNDHYASLHPKEMNPEYRKKCLFVLKKLGYRVGSGFMVGSPGQTMDNLADDLEFLRILEPDMIGIGPFLPHSDTPFCNEKKGSLYRTLRLIAVLRLMFPYALIPSTTALGTLHPDGRELGLRAGANVVMPNLSPPNTRELYSLYDGKLSTGAEAAEHIEILKEKLVRLGMKTVVDVGDVKPH